MAQKKVKMSKEDKDREARTREYLTKQAKDAIKVRNKEAEFHGLEREFIYHQENMLKAYEESKDIKHPRDVGDIRETLLWKFLTKTGYIPHKYGISESRVRIASSSGHLSPEMDIVLFDRANNISLMNREGVYEVFPIESVLGVVQVKSKLTKETIQNGLENIAAFKRLNKEQNRKPFINIGNELETNRGFGILFAYDSDMEWLDVVNELEDYAKKHTNTEWCNCVIVLNQGMFLYGNERLSSALNYYLAQISEVKIHGFPDRESLCLYQFYSVLTTLLSTTKSQEVNIGSYFNLPVTAEDLSYKFSFGHFRETGECEKHGTFLRKISKEALEKIVEFCKNTQPINWIKAIDIAYEKPENLESYAKQPMDVRIYNPEKHELKDILLMDSTFQGKSVKSLAYDSIECGGMVIWIPYYYTVKEKLISGCPKCDKKK
ncbi:putative uncharacterized protein [Proteobacteria bacterium CAG:495]|nr:putative uncharacterized protein [Proteobacteria bacterium CAG:495]